MAERLASYNLLAVAVCDDQRRLARRHHRGRRARPDVAGRLAAAASPRSREVKRPAMKHRHEDLSRPRRPRRSLGIHYDPDAFGEFSEAIARNLGTARFLVIQTVLVVLWIVLNVALVTLRWDPYPFILLNLAFSTQAAYAAPLILLAQNRQEAARPGPGRDGSPNGRAHPGRRRVPRPRDRERPPGPRRHGDHGGTRRPPGSARRGAAGDQPAARREPDAPTPAPQQPPDEPRSRRAAG